MANKIEDTTSYKVGFGIADILYKAICGGCSLLLRGIKAAFKNIYIASVYVFLVTATIVSKLIIGSCAFMVFLTALIIIAVGIGTVIKEMPMKRKIKYFAWHFEKIKLGNAEDNIPCYLGEETISDFLLSVSFATTIPLKIWEHKKDELETSLNNKIVDIRQDENNYQIVHVIFETEPLPPQIDWHDDYIKYNKNIFNIGMGYYGVLGMNLEKQPHAFIAGETGSGKSNILKCMIHQALIKEYDVILIDFKRGASFSAFEKFTTVYFEYKTVIKVLNELVKETQSRLDKFRNAHIDNISDYNRRTTDYLPRKIVFIDELAELLRTRDKDTANKLNDSIETLTRLSRAVGIHLIMGIQRPDSTIVSGQIKNNVSFRVCGRFVDREPSRIMLGEDMVSTLPNTKGRFIVKDDGFYEMQAFYFGEDTFMRYKKKPKESAEPTTPDVEQPTLVQKKPPTPVVTPREAPNKIQFDFSDVTRKPANIIEPVISHNSEDAEEFDDVFLRPSDFPRPKRPEGLILPSDTRKKEEIALTEDELEIMDCLKKADENIKSLQSILNKNGTYWETNHPILLVEEYHDDLKRDIELTNYVLEKLFRKMELLFLRVVKTQIESGEILKRSRIPYLSDMIILAELLKSVTDNDEIYDNAIESFSNIEKLLLNNKK